MSYLCGVLLMFMQQQEAFTAFSNLLTNPFMSSICRIDLSLMAKHSQLFQMILAHNVPTIHAHFHQIEITTGINFLSYLILLSFFFSPPPLLSHVFFF